MKKLTAITTLLLLYGCNGHVREISDLTKHEVDKDNKKVTIWTDDGYPADPAKGQGLRVFMPALMRVTSRTTTYTEEKKPPTYRCNPKEIVQIVTRADYSQPLRVYYDPGLFESVQFGVTLTPDGTLASVTSSGTPPTAAITAAIPAAIAAIAPLATPNADTPQCNTDPVVIKIEKCVQKGATVCEVP